MEVGAALTMTGERAAAKTMRVLKKCCMVIQNKSWFRVVEGLCLEDLSRVDW